MLGSNLLDAAKKDELFLWRRLRSLQLGSRLAILGGKSTILQYENDHVRTCSGYRNGLLRLSPQMNPRRSRLLRLKRIEAGEQGWQGTAWALERLHPSRFARPEAQFAQQINVNTGRPRGSGIILDPEALQALSDAYDRERAKEG
jgi:hypothetical protein